MFINIIKNKYINKDCLNFSLILFILLFSTSLFALTPSYSSERHGYINTTQLQIPEGGFSAPCFYDWYKDKGKDLIVGTGNGLVLVYRNIGTADSPKYDNFSYEKIIKNGLEEIHPFIGSNSDVTGDNIPDLIVSFPSTGEVYYYTNTASASAMPSLSAHAMQLSFGTNGVAVIGDNDRWYGGWAVLGKADGGTSLDMICSFYGTHVVGGQTNTGGKIGIYTNILSNSTNMVYACTNANEIVLNCGLKGAIANLDATDDLPYVAYADWDGDGIMDIIAAYQDHDKGSVPVGGYYTKLYVHSTVVKWFKGTATFNEFTAQGEIKDDNGNSLNTGLKPKITVLKYDSDTKPDLVIGDYLGNFRLFKGGSNPSIVTDKLTIQGGSTRIFLSTSTVKPDLADWDNDGDLDLFLGTFSKDSAGSFYYFRNYKTELSLSSNRFQYGLPFTDSNNKMFGSQDFGIPYIQDVNNDGKPDLIWSGSKANGVGVCFNVGTRTNPAISTATTDIYQPSAVSGYYYAQGKYADMDDDGIYDYFFAQTINETRIATVVSNAAYYSITNVPYISPEIPEFLSINGEDMFYIGSYVGSINIIDFDDDGIKDFLQGVNGSVLFLKNNASSKTSAPTFSSYSKVEADGVPIITGAMPQPIVVHLNDDDGNGIIGNNTDIDHKDWLDLVIGSGNGYIEVYYGARPRYVALDSETNMPASSLYFYPNPLTEQDTTIKLKCLVRDDTIITLIIYNISGRIVSENEYSLKYSESIPISIDTSNLVNGTYIAEITAVSSKTGEIEKQIRKFSIRK